MKQFILMVSAATLGAIIGHFGSTRIDKTRAATVEKVEVRELVLLNEKNQTAARLQSVHGLTVLRLYSDNAAPAMELGVDMFRPSRFVRFFGSDGRVLAALNSAPTYGEATLYLGDERWETRMILGALRTDSQSSAGIDEWGLQFRKPGSRTAIFTALARPDRSGSNWGAGLRLVLQNGKEWEAR